MKVNRCRVLRGQAHPRDLVKFLSKFRAEELADMLRTPEKYYTVHKMGDGFILGGCSTKTRYCDARPFTEGKLKKLSGKAFRFFEAHKEDSPGMAEMVAPFDTISEMLRPVVHYDKAEAFGSAPEWITRRIKDDRLKQMMKGEMGLATMSELVSYMNEWSMAQPLSPEYARVYMYAARELMKDQMGGKERMVRAVPKVKLSPSEEGLMKDLRRWLYRKGAKKVQDKLYEDIP